MRANAGYVGAHPPCALGSLVYMGVRVNATTYHGIPSRKSVALSIKVYFVIFFRLNRAFLDYNNSSIILST